MLYYVGLAQKAGVYAPVASATLAGATISFVEGALPMGIGSSCEFQQEC
jgi:hypothetical protein